MEEGKYKYPKLSEEEKKAILVIANRLYEYIKLENTKCLDLYQDLQNEFLKQIAEKSESTSLWIIAITKQICLILLII